MALETTELDMHSSEWKVENLIPFVFFASHGLTCIILVEMIVKTHTITCYNAHCFTTCLTKVRWT